MEHFFKLLSWAFKFLLVCAVLVIISCFIGSLFGLGLAQASTVTPLLASPVPSVVYGALFAVTVGFLILLGCYCGKRDRAKIKKDLLGTKATPVQAPVVAEPPMYRIQEYRVVSQGGQVSSVFKVEQWDHLEKFYFSICKGSTTLAGAEALLVQRLEVVKQLNAPKICHEYERDGTPVPPAPKLSFPDNRPATLGDA